MLGGAVMITTLVQFQLPSPVSLAEATRRFEATAPEYQKLPVLIRKYYIRSEDGPHRGRRLSLADAAGGRAALQRRMGRARRKALRRQASHHLVRQSGRRR